MASGITTVDFATLLHFSQTSPTSVALPALLGLFTVVSWFDLRYGRIPDWIIGAGFVSAAFGGIAGGTAPRTIVLATLVGIGIPLTARWATGRRLGWGDVKLSLVLALLVGPQRAAAGLLLASVLALVGRIGSTSEAGSAFGPYLVAGVFIVRLLERLHGL